MQIRGQFGAAVQTSQHACHNPFPIKSYDWESLNKPFNFDAENTFPILPKLLNSRIPATFQNLLIFSVHHLI